MNMLITTLTTIAVLDELLFWIRCRELRLEVSKAMDRLTEVLGTPNNEHLYSTISQNVLFCQA